MLPKDPSSTASPPAVAPPNLIPTAAEAADDDEIPDLVEVAAPDASSSDAGAKVPVTVITGQLGSGKTTLLNHVLNGNHHKKIAVILNEFGEVSPAIFLKRDKT